MKLNEIILLEHYVNLLTRAEKEKYADEVWDMLQKAYEPIGGFYSIYFGEYFDAEYVAVNPVICPSEAFNRHLDSPPLNYSTGKPLKLRPEMLDELAKIEKAIEIPSGYLANIFLATDDDVVPYQPAMERFKHARWMKVTQDGGYHYDTNWSAVIARVRELF